jgi:hypothetical protein
MEKAKNPKNIFAHAKKFQNAYFNFLQKLLLSTNRDESLCKSSVPNCEKTIKKTWKLVIICRNFGK